MWIILKKDMEELAERGGRIEFVDLAKGVCILMVVAGHCGFHWLTLPGYNTVRMPLYFVLSGLFFKDYGGWSGLLVRKTNKILVPFLFFYLLAYVVFYLLKWFAPSLLVTTARGICDVFNNRQYFNGPLWFLLALFWCHVLFYAITRMFRHDGVRIAAVLLVCVGGVI